MNKIIKNILFAVGVVSMLALAFYSFGGQSAVANTQNVYYSCNGDVCQSVGLMTLAECESMFGTCYLTSNCDNQCCQEPETYPYYGCSGDTCQYLGEYINASACGDSTGKICYESSNCNNQCYAEPTKYDYYGCSGSICQYLGRYTDSSACYNATGKTCYTSSNCDNQCYQEPTKYDYYGCYGSVCQYLGRYTSSDSCYQSTGKTCYTSSNCNNACYQEPTKYDYYSCYGSVCQYVGRYTSAYTCQSATGKTCYTSSNCNNACYQEPTKYNYYGCYGDTCSYLGRYTDSSACYNATGKTCYTSSNCNNQCYQPPVNYDFYSCSGSVCQYAGKYTSTYTCQLATGKTCYTSSNCDNQCYQEPTKYDYYGCTNNVCQYLGRYTDANACYQATYKTCYTDSNCNGQCYTQPPVTYDYYGCTADQCLWLGKYENASDCQTAHGKTCYTSSNCNNQCQQATTTYNYYACEGNSCQYMGQYESAVACQTAHVGKLCYTSSNCDNQCGGGGGPVAPTIRTTGTGEIGLTCAFLKGELTGMGSDSTVNVWFEYGLDIINVTTSTSETKNQPNPFEIKVCGLTQGTTYKFRATGKNSTIHGDWMEFTTQEISTPIVTTNAASGVTTNSATLNGTINSFGTRAVDAPYPLLMQIAEDLDNGDVWFEWGLTNTYGNTTSKVNHTQLEAFAEQITGLSVNTTYHYRACIENTAGNHCGEDVIFITGTSGGGGGTHHYVIGTGAGSSYTKDLDLLIYVRNLSRNEKIWKKETVANPGDRVAFSIKLINDGDTALQKVVLNNTLPSRIKFAGNVTVDGKYSTLDLRKDINFGKFEKGEEKIINFEATVATANYFTQGSVALKDIAKAASGINTAQDSATVVVLNGVSKPAPSVIKTGLSSNIRDFVLLPILLSLIALILFRNHFVYAVAGWDNNVLKARNFSAQRELEKKIQQMKKD